MRDTTRLDLPRRDFLSLGAGAALLGAGVRPARAKNWPDGPIRIVLSQAAGSGPDQVARAIGDHMASKLGVACIVESRPGANGLLAADTAARAAPDGQTLLLGLYSQYAQATVLHKKPIIDPVKTLQPIALLGTGVGPLLVRKDFPAQNFREFLAIARTRPVSFGSFSIGSNAHLMILQFAQDANAKIDVIPYKGAAPMLTDLAAGHVDCGICSLASAKAFMQQERVRPILVVTNKRSAALPGLGTWAEEGFASPTYDLKEYFLGAAPIGTPNEVVSRVAALVEDAAVHSEALKNIRKTLFEEEPPLVGEPLDQMIRTTVPIWHTATRALGVVLD